jgi:hypothetical protein
MTDEFNTATDDEIKQMEIVGNRVVNAEKLTFTTAYILKRRPKANGAHAVLIEELYSHLAGTASMVKIIQTGILGRTAGD